MQVEQFCSGDLWHTVKIPGGRLQYLAENCLQIPGNPEINRSLAFLQSKEQKAKSWCRESEINSEMSQDRQCKLHDSSCEPSFLGPNLKPLEVQELFSMTGTSFGPDVLAAWVEVYLFGVNTVHSTNLPANRLFCECRLETTWIKSVLVH